VLDPMMGSGTTGKMAIKNGRNFIGIELSTQYVEIAKKRIALAEAPIVEPEPQPLADTASQSAS